MSVSYNRRKLGEGNGRRYKFLREVFYLDDFIKEFVVIMLGFFSAGVKKLLSGIRKLNTFNGVNSRDLANLQFFAGTYVRIFLPLV